MPKHPEKDARPLERLGSNGERIVDLADLKEAPTNARKRTERSAYMIQNSLAKYGAGRSLLVDENLELMAGHGVREEALQAGFKRVRIIETDGETLVAVMRKGMTRRQKAGMRIADNRAAELSTWGHDELLKEGELEDLSQFFFDSELGIESVPADPICEPSRTQKCPMSGQYIPSKE